MDRKITDGRIVSSDDWPTVDWAVATKPKHAGQDNGDAYLLTRSGPRIVAAVIDGSGSGSPAYEVSDRCLGHLENWDGRDVAATLASLHDALRGSRGCAVCLGVVNLEQSEFTWVAVGDVNGELYTGGSERKRVGVIQQGGTIGLHLPRIKVQRCDLPLGTLIVMSSDGVGRDMFAHLGAELGPVETVRRGFDGFARANDDSTVLALKVRGQ